MIERQKIESILDKVRPSIQADGGDVELINIRDDNVIEVRLKGTCNGCPMATLTLKACLRRLWLTRESLLRNGCPMATLTLKAGIERIIKEEVPEVKEVIAV